MTLQVVESPFAISKGLEHLGPKHHAIVLGKNIKDGLVYIAERVHTGYQVVTYNSFNERHANNGTIYIHKNDGDYDGIDAANKALSETKAGGKGVYNLITNNCVDGVKK
ncbi:hypothetical protein [Oceanospirillum linum]|uniref:LRAT domain-containing protein n=1 Tax=Oceanospirillum linum TaxID=966 RepID=A0A1T1H8W9_OCELI|nr:hypothetical protein [Oceanospirillum linum]OOV86301.1 hypothetical protein BTA35_0213870 [Oceanospirillum linum]SEG47136.1 hypothetical protein SAMN04489856_11223 [Oleiphilus messinensis]SMP30936.1 hypothetical protein SAMN06264348_10840 [Oceanospirillum linum]